MHYLAFNPKDNITRVDCKNNTPKDKKPCEVKLNAFQPCTKEKKFGYEEGRPCIFLKLNKIFNWIPDYYNETNSFPSDMPGKLQTHIDGRIKIKQDTKVVWVSCEGENPADIENLGREVSYYSLSGEQGFLGKYFPFNNTEGYLQPLVAVQFKSVKRKYSRLWRIKNNVKKFTLIIFQLVYW